MFLHKFHDKFIELNKSYITKKKIYINICINKNLKNNNIISNI